MEFITRDATKEDMPQVLNLIKELALFEKEPEAVEVTVDDLILDGFGDHKLFHCFVAEANNTVVGLALVYNRYSTWKGPVLHLEDLIVTQKMRGSGLGTLLLNEVIKYGHSQGVKRICWEVLDWNEPAIKFYQSKGADVKRDWDVVHLDEKGIENYIANL
ncbi:MULTISPECIES: GNAT family N-acetyltransferase [Cellulophaga]|uniref:N-acetyltransferase GCN5 n=1 Tax=Cellulophaga geojensis KL-A TaxID=1328323 RepID=A0ABN0RKR2_9FLAO|nr:MULTISPECIES: GNAT family N-acetyltransferase [Cellulophaga]APU10441.1 GNAT family acetyltransferase [Cellulophaga lytica]EWH12463.1 N-acetyltransferase GCN5 [Cellulophaga geojensis KL-A]MDO6852362.1 GNAT family N-acetyltransferase [Cellulophaga lytica]TVZ07879.1 L-amino acid N-acyltransferase YncA [Cellulophaga sp. RHA_52]SNQ42733.1 GCN5-related N-acetyltransferase [Cellulophaga lytica]